MSLLFYEKFELINIDFLCNDLILTKNNLSFKFNNSILNYEKMQKRKKQKENYCLYKIRLLVFLEKFYETFFFYIIGKFYFNIDHFQMDYDVFQ